MQGFDDYRLGESTEVVAVTTGAEARAAVLALVSQARRSVEIVSRHLDPRLYDQPDFVDAAKRLSLGSSRARIRMVVQEVAPVLRQGHRLLELARRLPSFLQIRVPAAEFRGFNQAFLVADGVGYLHRELADRFEGTASFHGPLLARELLRQFEPLWETGSPDPGLRSLRI
jgi:hypothetical protein